MYLVDTNMWLERLLDQERSEEVGRFLDAIFTHNLFMTDFCLHSIGIVLTRLKKVEIFERFLSDAIEDSGVGLLRLDAADLRLVISAHQQFRLDFDDAYQYAAARKHDLTIVSLDSDFDRTDAGRKTPSQVLKDLAQQTDQAP